MYNMSSTDNQEAAQAYFCAIVDFLGDTKAHELKKYNTYAEFVQFWGSRKPSLQDVFNQHVKSGKSRFADVENVLKNDAWYKSSRNIGIKLIQEVTKNKTLMPFSRIAPPGWKQIFYAHQDAAIMDMVSKLFTIVSENHAKNSTKGKGWSPRFSDINKWSPADIYFADDTAVRELQQATITAKSDTWSYTELNTFMYKLWTNGHLLPVSLKKAGDSVTIKYVNFESKWNTRLKAYTPNSIELKMATTEGDRRARVIFTIPDGSQYSLEFATKCSYPVRQAAGNTGLSGLETKIKIELIPIGGSAKEGQVGPEAIDQIIGLSQKIKSIIKTADTERKQFKESASVKKLITERTRQVQTSLQRSTAPSPKKKTDYFATPDGKTAKFLTETGKQQTLAFQKSLATLAANSFEGTLLKQLRTHFSSDVGINDIRLLFLYAAARSQDSAKYIIAK